MNKKSFLLIKIIKNHGRHTDVYVDFENQILAITQWKSVNAARGYLQETYNKFILPQLKNRVLNFNLSSLSSPKYLFAVISGTEYSKLFLRFSFKAKQKVIYMFDPWIPLNQLNENAFRSYKINIAFFSAKQAVTHFNSRSIDNFKAYWIPEGVNSESYKYCNFADKTIDVIQYGRQWDWVHNRLVELNKIKKIDYEFPSHKDFQKSQFATREQLVEALAKSKVAICVPRNITHPQFSGELSTLTTRYFECMSSKCLIWGKAPNELIELFGYNPIIEIDMENPEKQLQELIANYSSYIPLIEKNYELIISKHQWKHRIDDMLEILNNK